MAATLEVYRSVCFLCVFFEFMGAMKYMAVSIVLQLIRFIQSPPLRHNVPARPGLARPGQAKLGLAMPGQAMSGLSQCGSDPRYQAISPYG